MTNRTGDTNALKHLDLEIEKAREAAGAEEAYGALKRPEGPNPWANAKQRLEQLLVEREQLELRVKGEQLSKGLAELLRLDEELERAQEERQIADRAVLEHSKNEVVKRYLESTSTCMRMGWGYSWSMFRPWYESGNPRYIGLSDTATFFLDSPQAGKAGVLFDLGKERESVMAYFQSVSIANTALAKCGGLAEMRAALLRERPELKTAT